MQGCRDGPGPLVRSPPSRPPLSVSRPTQDNLCGPGHPASPLSLHAAPPRPNLKCLNRKGAASARSSPDPAARPAFCVLTFCFCLPRPPKRGMAVGASAGWRRSATPSVFTGTRRLPNFVSQVASLPSVSRLVLAQMRQSLHHWYTSPLSRTFLSALSHLTTKVVYLPRPLVHKKTFRDRS